MDSEKSEAMNGQRPNNNYHGGNRRHNNFKNRNSKVINNGENKQNSQSQAVINENTQPVKNDLKPEVNKENRNENRDQRRDFSFKQRRNDEGRFNRFRQERRNPAVETKDDIKKDCERIESQIIDEINDIKTINTSLF